MLYCTARPLESLNPNDFSSGAAGAHTIHIVQTTSVPISAKSSMTVMSFGFSVGDFLAVLTVAKDLALALRDTKGVPVELQQLNTMLDSLQKAINDTVQVAEEWDLAHPKPSNIVPFSALVGEHKTCKTLLDNFQKGSEK
jgi:hypothetical protein